MQRIRISLGLACLFWSAFGWADDEGVAFPKVGKIQPRTSTEIVASNWSVGAEAMDLGQIVYDNSKDYLGLLGVKKARIQAGWWRTESKPGVYDFAWLDAVVFDMPKRGVTPWMNLSYGNPIYQGAGGVHRTNVPTSKIGLAAWQRWVKATVERYQDVIDEWEIWNEPNYRVKPEDYARLLMLTAETIRSVQPKAKIVAFALGSKVDYQYADKVLALVQAEGKIDLIDQISHHRHIRNPDDTDAEIALEKVVRKYSDKIVIRQGEAGCPSGPTTRHAMANYPWTELIQSKHVLRRLLGDLGRDKESSVFRISDSNGAIPPDQSRTLGKGLLATRNDGSVKQPKPAYHAVQNVTSVFDCQMNRVRDFAYDASAKSPLSVYGYRHSPSGGAVVTVWFRGAIPSNDNTKTPVDFTFDKVQFTEPVYVDMRTGAVYSIPASIYSKEGGAWRFRQIPCYDSPILIADRRALRVVKDDGPPGSKETIHLAP
jgi:hypothetical protein